MRFLLAPVLMFFSMLAGAQVSVDLSGAGVKAGAGSKNTVANEQGAIDPDADIEGVVIINDQLYIDGHKISRGAAEYVSKKTRKVYSIRWGKKGEGVTVTEKN
ncbi:MAG: hypothetical protein V5B31_20300 [Candidatus Accumulibacter propinquus]|jgi:hypothetical protein|uniref:hypothetical protein n=1 Tax=Candidatus Accumulibacter propinquus TaxID=2954380 RepID=UPI002FC2B402